MTLTPFLQSLLVEPRPTDVTNWAQRHNDAVRSQAILRSTRISDRRQPEHAILSLAQGIDIWASVHADGDPDYIAAEILEDLVRAFSSALNYDLGRLDGGTLSSWIHARFERATGRPLDG